LSFFQQQNTLVLNVKWQQEAGNVLYLVKFSRDRRTIAIRENSGQRPYYGPEI